MVNWLPYESSYNGCKYQVVSTNGVSFVLAVAAYKHEIIGNWLIGKLEMPREKTDCRSLYMDGVHVRACGKLILQVLLLPWEMLIDSLDLTSAFTISAINGFTAPDQKYGVFVSEPYFQWKMALV